MGHLSSTITRQADCKAFLTPHPDGNKASVHQVTYRSNGWLDAMNQAHSHNSMPPSSTDTMHTAQPG